MSVNKSRASSPGDCHLSTQLHFIQRLSETESSVLHGPVFCLNNKVAANSKVVAGSHSRVKGVRGTSLVLVLVDLRLSVVNFPPITRASQPDNFALAESEHNLCALSTYMLKKLLLLIQRVLSVITQEVSLTLHGEGLSRHRDVVLALCGEAVMQQVVFLWEFHHRVICGRGQRSRIRANHDTNKQEKRG